MRTEKEIEEVYGKSIWDMTTDELIENDLISDWVDLIDSNSKE